MAASLPAWQRLATVLLDQELGEWVAERRSHPYQPSWRLIADELERATKGEVTVTGETLRLWFAEQPEGVAS